MYEMYQIVIFWSLIVLLSLVWFGWRIALIGLVIFWLLMAIIIYVFPKAAMYLTWQILGRWEGLRYG